MFKILLIGCGKLGQCYLRSILENLDNLSLVTVDPYVDIDYQQVSHQHFRDLEEIKDQNCYHMF